MNCYGFYWILYWTFFAATSAGAKPQIKGDGNHLNELNSMKIQNEVTDRDIRQYWGDFMTQKTSFQSKFDEMICITPENLRKIHSTMHHFIEKTEMAWHLKQEQLKELNVVLHHEKYTDTALAKGDHATADLCAGLNNYIIKVNATTHTFKKEIDMHLKEVIAMKIKMDKAPCPCEWGHWSAWSKCSTTCEAGKTQRGRKIAKAAINNGMECKGPSSEEKICNQNVCCPVDCVWSAWEEWPSCPSGCPVGGGIHHKIRTRTKAIKAMCNGQECDGLDFEKRECSREQELLQLLNKCTKKIKDECNYRK